MDIGRVERVAGLRKKPQGLNRVRKNTLRDPKSRKGGTEKSRPYA